MVKNADQVIVKYIKLQEVSLCKYSNKQHNIKQKDISEFR